MFTKQQLLTHYETMVTIRAFEMEAKRAREANEILGNVHVYVGEEAIATGVCANLGPKDCIESTHRGHGHTIAKGADINAMMAELYGKATGCCRGKGGSQHIADFSVGMLGANGIVGGGYGPAVGAALAARILNTGAISVVFFGDGASNRGTFHEAANLAAAYRLPVVFVCENNSWACATPSEVGRTQSVNEISRRAIGYDMASYVVNGNDFFAVYEAMQKLVERARKGEGNCCGMLECQTFRVLGHIIGDSQSYRDPHEAYARLRADDCIENFERRCIAEGWLHTKDFTGIQEKVATMIQSAKQFAVDSPYPDASALTTDLYD